MKHRKLFFCLLLLFKYNLSFNQQKKSYLEFSTGVKNMNIIDFKTSPLKYKGHLFSFSLAHTDVSNKRQSTFRANGATGNLFNNSNNQNSTSKINSLEIDYKELYKINSLSSYNTNIKIGGFFNTIVNIRENEALLNSAKGVELFSTLFASLKSTFYIKNQSTTNHFYVDINYGVLNAAYRNGFAYINQSPILNDEDFFEDYSFRLFSGLRLQTNIAYSWQLKTTNAIKFSYRWDVLKATHKKINYQMASHHLALTFYFKL